MSPLVENTHPGVRIKAEVIPPGMSLTEAAQLAGVTRRALSNLLNGNSSLSTRMAARLEKAFGCPRKDLLAMQTKYDAERPTELNVPVDIKSYVAPFLGIKANQIESWVENNIVARTRLSVFLRTLVNSTGFGLVKVDFPGNDDAERPRWDGVVEAIEGTSWIPEGRSGWEFGVNKKIKAKADGDFKKSVEALSKEERETTTFVFVTPRRWAGKNAWIASVKEKKLWKDVHAYDASDLEQWIEQSLPAQAWFANETNIPAQDVRSLDKCWADWANVATPPLTGALFCSAIEATKRTVESRLSKPADGPTIIAADSTEEALAFLAQLFSERGSERLTALRDSVLVFDKPGVLPRLVQGGRLLIPVIHTRDVEREVAPYAKSMHSFIVYPRNATSSEPHIALEPANYDSFDKALKEMGKNRDETRRLADESGRSLTVVRRRLATVEAVRTPQWAVDHKAAVSLIPFLFVGAWQSTNDADRTCLSLLAGDRPYDDLERDVQSLIQLNDTPVWSIGTFRGVISKIDLLYAIAGIVTEADLSRYYSIASMVLGEDDPSLDLVEDQRWAASIRGKTREFSSAFRQGVSETLVILAVHGGQLFRKRLGIDPQDQAASVVRDLLRTPLTTRTLEANDRDLPTYAEAAPNEFLSILERDLKEDAPALIGLLRPASTTMFGHPSRTGLLWALEALAWNPLTLPRVVCILARLAKVEIADNWANKPINSLEAIFRSWMPQTGADTETRIKLMNMLAGRFPDLAWKVCIAQFGVHNRVGHYSHKPRWRPDGYGFGEPLSTWDPILQFNRNMVEMALRWGDHTLSTMSDLVERLHNLDDAYRVRVWELIETWAKAKASDADKAALREKIRVTILSHRAAVRASTKSARAALTGKSKAAYDALEPNDVLNKHAWLFLNSWVDESADEIEGLEDFDHLKREERIRKLRVEALREVRKAHGLPALLELAKRGNASWEVGIHAARDLLPESELIELLRTAWRAIEENPEIEDSSKNLIAGAVRALQDNDRRVSVLNAIAISLSNEAIAHLLLLSPFGKVTWNLVDGLCEPAQNKYWSEVIPNWIHDSDMENNEGIERLLKANRPRAAFSCARFQPEKLDVHMLYRLLSAIAVGGNDKPTEYVIQNYNLDQAFKYIDASPALTLDQKASIEFAFLEALARPWNKHANGHGIPNLERYVEHHPELFVQAVVWAYKRKDGGMDPIGFHVPDDRIASMAARGRNLLEAIERIPGYDDSGELQSDRLAEWVLTVRAASTELSRAEVADLSIGKLLANAPVGKDGIWPCEAVREVMEDIQSDLILDGARTEVYNSRGVHYRGEGGDQERELAEKYRRWGQALHTTYPYVSTRLLMDLARTYESKANSEDIRAGIRRRLR
jgi:addiction module HigA family antidote